MKTVNYDALFEQMDKTLTFAKVPHGDVGIAANLDAWCTNKGNLIELLRKHSKWNEDAMAIILDEASGRMLYEDDFMAMCRELRDVLRVQNMRNIAFTWECDGPYWGDLNVRNIDATLAKTINDSAWKQYATARVGQKMSRYLRQLLLGMGVPNDCAPVWKQYAKIADALNPVDIVRPLIISVNPSDYLMMSYGDNWSSCHIINPDIVERCTNHYRGQSKVGCLSYMTDECGIITYTVNEMPADLADLPITHRHTRQMFFMNMKSNQLMQSRMYPYTHDLALIDIRRTILQGVIAECLNVPNLWRKRSTYKGFETNGPHYPDYKYVDAYEISVSYQSDREFDDESVQLIGSTPLCVKCGKEVTAYGQIICDPCLYESTCGCCGDHIDFDDPESYRVINGRNYHNHCTYWCAHCHEYHAGGANA